MYLMPPRLREGNGTANGPRHPPLQPFQPWMESQLDFITLLRSSSKDLPWLNYFPHLCGHLQYHLES